MEVNLKTTKTFMSMFGYWPFQNRVQKIFMRFFSIAPFLHLHIAQIFALYGGRHDMELVVKRMPFFIIGFIYYVHLLFFYIKSSKIECLLKDLSDDFENMKPHTYEMEILKKATNEGCSFVSTYSTSILVCGALYSAAMLTPAFCNLFLPKSKEMETYYLYDLDYVIIDYKKHYFLTNFHGFIGGALSVSGVVAGEVILHTFIQHSCGMFQVLKYRLQNIANVMNDKNGKKLILKKNNKMVQNVISCLTLYRHVLDYTQRIDDCFSTFLLFSTGVVVALMTFQSFMMVKNIKNIRFVMKNITIIIGQTAHVFANCLSGQILLNNSTCVINFIYEINWYDMPVKVQKMLLMMMKRSVKESKLMVGVLVDLSIETYSTLMKMTFSYMSVLNSIQ